MSIHVLLIRVRRHTPRPIPPPQGQGNRIWRGSQSQESFWNQEGNGRAIFESATHPLDSNWNPARQAASHMRFPCPQGGRCLHAASGVVPDRARPYHRLVFRAGDASGTRAMQIENSFVVPVDSATAWRVLLDVPRMARCMPGATLTDARDDRTYAGNVAVKLGPVRLTFAGEARITELDDAGRRAQGQAQGNEPKVLGRPPAKRGFAHAAHVPG